MFLVCNPESDDMHVKVLDTAKGDNLVGTAVVRVSDVIKSENMEIATQVQYKKASSCVFVYLRVFFQPFHLQGGSSESTITLACQVRALMEPRKKSAVQKQPSPDPVKPAASPASGATVDSKPTAVDAAGDKVTAPAAADVPRVSPERPSVDEMVVNTIKPALESAASSKEQVKSATRKIYPLFIRRIETDGGDDERPAERGEEEERGPGRQQRQDQAHPQLRPGMWKTHL